MRGKMSVLALNLAEWLNRVLRLWSPAADTIGMGKMAQTEPCVTQQQAQEFLCKSQKYIWDIVASQGGRCSEKEEVSAMSNAAEK
jgi:hypothetical protein